MKIKISADSVCDLPAELIEKHNIGVVPGYIVRNDVAYQDCVDITPEDIYEAFESGGVCTTAAINMADYIDRFLDYTGEYDAVIHFTISSKMSANYQNACLAARDTDGEVYPIDSKNLSTGVGLLVLTAAEMAESGAGALEIKTRVEELRDKLDVSFVIEKLDYLRKGGRCSALAAFGANLLSLKPCIEVTDGAMGVGKKFRGSLQKCLEEYVKERLSDRADIDFGRVFITHTKMDPALLDTVRGLIGKYGRFEEVLESLASCTISNHCGPNTLGVLFFKK
jgi:DegV family protein with EDD domain